MFYSILVSAPRGRSPTAPPNEGVNSLSYGVIHNCSVRQESVKDLMDLLVFMTTQV